MESERSRAEIKTCYYAGLSADGKQKRIEIEGKMKVWPAKVKIKLPVGTAFLLPVFDKGTGDGTKPLTALFNEIEIRDDIVYEARKEYKNWIVTNAAGLKARTMTATLNKLRRESDKDIYNLTINEIQHEMLSMTNSQKAALCALILQRLGWYA